ncbi:MAG: hypothetical protein ACREQM_04335, partial [Candidatus Dormibacteraceae bacterium]
PDRGPVIRQTTLLTRVVTIDNAAVRALRERVLHVVLGISRIGAGIAAQNEETDVAYPKSPVVIERGAHDHGPRAGEVAPDVGGLGAAGDGRPVTPCSRSATQRRPPSGPPRRTSRCIGVRAPADDAGALESYLRGIRGAA